MALLSEMYNGHLKKTNEIIKKSESKIIKSKFDRIKNGGALYVSLPDEILKKYLGLGGMDIEDDEEGLPKVVITGIIIGAIVGVTV